MSDINTSGLQSVQLEGQINEAGLVKAALTNQGINSLIAPVSVASTAAIVVSSGNQIPPQLNKPNDAVVLDGSDVFLLIGFALIGMVAIVRRHNA